MVNEKFKINVIFKTSVTERSLHSCESGNCFSAFQVLNWYIYFYIDTWYYMWCM